MCAIVTAITIDVATDNYHNFFCGAATQRGSWPIDSWGFLDHTQRRTTVGRTPLDEWSARRRDFYLTAHNTYNRQTSMHPVGFEPTISAELKLLLYTKKLKRCPIISAMCLCAIWIFTHNPFPCEFQASSSLYLRSFLLWDAARL